MKRIAVVEDEVYMREELCNMLQKDGYLAEAITELEDAVRLLAALRPNYSSLCGCISVSKYRSLERLTTLI